MLNLVYVLFGLIVLLLITRFTIQKKRYKRAVTSNEISEIKTFKLGGKEQKVLIEGKKKNLPVLITLHGGVGGAFGFNIGCRGLFEELTSEYIVVYWDQYGIGKNTGEINSDLTVETYVKMTVDLIKSIKNEYPDNKLFLFGVSWGSMLTCKSTNQMSQYIDGVVVFGHLLNRYYCTPDVFETLLSKDIKKEDIEFLNSIEGKKYLEEDELRKVCMLVHKKTNGNEYREKNVSCSKIYKLFLNPFLSPDYSLIEALRVYSKCRKFLKKTNLFEEIRKADLEDDLSKITVPYYILQGKEDLNTSTQNICGFVNESSNDNLHVKIINKSGHIPSNSGFVTLIEEVAKFKRKVENFKISAKF
ncbi:alpha/beta fold hydrolase [Herbivorax sp. ANBcel31]|uniref:alpha/beta fold hydrolase n=1 Tax=Herbivorax sp. ANBcel31 TaxID=3069754 RepID=UPI0027B50DD5|nr:alpha/beta fold hydrolase [Herbivorax sp. ANBcel31]MDQ2088001.1 alpha/beta fold hydrolase [Herbivorax sp. ANBcel31]